MNKYQRRRQAEPEILAKLNAPRRPGVGQHTVWREDLGLPPSTDIVQRDSALMQPVAAPAGEPQRIVKTVTAITPTEAANAFVIRTRPIARMAATSMALVWLLVRWAVPVVTGAATAGVLIVGIVAILAGLLAYLVTWSLAYAVDMIMSPGGLGLFEAWRTHRRLDRQSDAMVRAFERQHGIEEK